MKDRMLPILLWVFVLAAAHNPTLAQQDADSCKKAFCHELLGRPSHDSYIYYTSEDSLHTTHYSIANWVSLVNALMQKKGIQYEEALDLIANKFYGNQLVFPYKDFGFLSGMKVGNLDLVNKYARGGQKRFLKRFCQKYDSRQKAGLLKEKYTFYNFHNFPCIVAAAYKLHIILATVEENECITYVSDCNF